MRKNDIIDVAGKLNKKFRFFSGFGICFYVILVLLERAETPNAKTRSTFHTKT